jgi:hypothetical protein
MSRLAVDAKKPGSGGFLDVYTVDLFNNSRLEGLGIMSWPRHLYAFRSGHDVDLKYYYEIGTKSYGFYEVIDYITFNPINFSHGTTLLARSYARRKMGLGPFCHATTPVRENRRTPRRWVR